MLGIGENIWGGVGREERREGLQRRVRQLWGLVVVLWCIHVKTYKIICEASLFAIIYTSVKHVKVILVFLYQKLVLVKVKRKAVKPTNLEKRVFLKENIPQGI